MTWAVVEPLFGSNLKRASCIDLASHEGFFSIHRAQRCEFVRGFECNNESLDAARRIAVALRVSDLEFIDADVNSLDPNAHEPADIVLMYGLLYHLENPIDVLHKAAALTRQVLIVEAQTTGNTREGGTSNIVLVDSNSTVPVNSNAATT
jgi:tRNA (mo5U34)-methyltransferase